MSLTPSKTKTLPLAVPELPGGPPCHKCSALCCRYYALEIDAPEDEDDFEDLRWYVIHGNSWVWVEDGDWFLQVEEACRFLGENGACTIYDKRPKVCRQYGMPEHLDSPDDPLCDYFAQDAKHDVELREPDEVAAYAKTFLAEKRAQAERRRKAAKKGWEKRRKRQS